MLTQCSWRSRTGKVPWKLNPLCWGSVGNEEPQHRADWEEHLCIPDLPTLCLNSCEQEAREHPKCWASSLGVLQCLMESQLKKRVDLELHLAGREQTVVRLGIVWYSWGPQPSAARGGCPPCPAPLHPGEQYLPVLMIQGDVGVQHSPCTWQIRRDALCQLVLDEHLQHQQELRQQGKAFYVERL